MTTTAICFDIASGHRLTYLSKLLTHLDAPRHGAVTIVLVPNAVAESSAFWDVVRPHQTVRVFAIESERLETVDLRNFENEYRLHYPDLHFVAFDGDHLIKRMATVRAHRRPRRITALQMRPEGQHEAPPVRLAQTITKAAVRFAAGRSHGVRAMYLTAPWLARHDSAVPDLCEVRTTPASVADARRRFGPPEGTLWFGILGAVTWRKNPQLVFDALCEYTDRYEVTAALSIIGRCDADTRAWLDQLQAPERVQVLEHNEFVSDQELDSIVATIDCIVLAHSNNGPSGILAKASAAGAAVISAGAPSLKRDCRALGGKATWVPLRKQDLAAAMQSIKRREKPFVGESDNTPDFCARLTNRHHAS